jgi:hypothetical protein
MLSPEQKQKKLQEAIGRGFIIKHDDPDGINRYELTALGKMQWIYEIYHKRSR